MTARRGALCTFARRASSNADLCTVEDADSTVRQQHTVWHNASRGHGVARPHRVGQREVKHIDISRGGRLRVGTLYPCPSNHQDLGGIGRRRQWKHMDGRGLGIADLQGQGRNVLVICDLRELSAGSYTAFDAPQRHMSAQVCSNGYEALHSRQPSANWLGSKTAIITAVCMATMPKVPLHCSQPGCSGLNALSPCCVSHSNMSVQDAKTSMTVRTGIQITCRTV